jgi:branched-chain amino acid transport system substrate-binding protein
MNQRLTAALASVLAVVVAAASACGGSGSKNSSTTSAGGTYTIGLDTAQTGYLAPYDQPALKGLRLAVNEINARGGIAGKYKIKLLVRDMRTDTGQAVIVAKELVGTDHVKLLITPCDADPSIAAGQIAQKAKVPAISFCASTPTLPPSVGNYMFTNFPGDNAEATVSAQYALKHGYRKVFLLTSPDTAYTSKLPEYFAVVFRRGGGTMVGHDTYKLGQQDFGPTIDKIKATNPKPDVIMSSAYEPEFPAFIKQLRAAGVTTPMIESDGIDTPTLTKLGSVVNGIVFTTAGFPAPGSALAQFNNKYKNAYGAAPDTVFAAIGYDLGLVIEAAVKKAGSIDPTEVRNALASLEDVQGVTGRITYTGTDGVPIRQVALVRVVNGKKTLLGEVTPKQSEIPPPQS